MVALARIDPSIDLDAAGTPEHDWRPWLEGCRLRRVERDELVPPGHRLVVVAPHPDDELLAAGGLVSSCASAGRDVCVIAVTDGTSSHPHSSLWPRARLGLVRPRESGEALRRLGIAARSTEVVRLGLQDARVAEREAELVERLRALVQPGDVVVSTWRHDGHPDHDAAGRASARAALSTGAAHVEAPVWAWQWARPGDSRVPWHRAVRLDIGLPLAARKRWAIGAHASQLESDPTTGRGAILPPDVIRHFVRPFEVFFR
jgi:LmbE family N-acetylglucosaminyl deacetylase